jgi:hypothetical protein
VDARRVNQKMGNSVFRSGGLLLSVNRDNAKLSESTQTQIQTLFDVLRANPKISIQRLEALLLQIPKVIKAKTVKTTNVCLSF